MTRITLDGYELPEMPTMTASEIKMRVRQWTGGQDIADLDYAEIVRLLTVTGYLTDLCVAELDSRELLTENPDNGMLILPDCRPDGLHVEGGLTQIGYPA